MSVIEMEHVYMKYRTRQNTQSAFSDFFGRQYLYKTVLSNMNLRIDQGELVGFIGPNGAGKSTTIKLLTGILSAAEGSVRVFDRNPAKHRTKNAFELGVVFGQRSQLLWTLPVCDTSRLNRCLYKLDRAEFKRNCDKLIDVIGLQDI